MNYIIPDKIFSYVLTMVAWSGLWVWTSIMLSHLFYRRSIAEKREKPGAFQLRGFPYSSWMVLSALGMVAMVIAWNGESRITFYLMVAWFTLLTTVYYTRASLQKVDKSLKLAGEELNRKIQREACSAC